VNPNTLKDTKALIERLLKLYASMDNAYAEAMERYGFSCSGCTDNCCNSRFHHHTIIECLCLHEGLKAALPEPREEMLKKAMNHIEGALCPVNSGGLCALYSHRPMICRLHGMPYVFAMPDGRRVKGGGCGRFNGKHELNACDKVIDRTPFYRELAEIERLAREAAGLTGRYKKTTAEILRGFQPSHS
jgi:Fe-S-cluster containining protein